MASFFKQLDYTDNIVTSVCYLTESGALVSDQKSEVQWIGHTLRKGEKSIGIHYKIAKEEGHLERKAQSAGGEMQAPREVLEGAVVHLSETRLLTNKSGSWKPKTDQCFK